MKTQVIRLNANDDLTSIRDQMAWAKTERILVVFHSQMKMPIRELELRLLKRSAAVLGAVLGIVSRDEALRQVAGELDLPAFPSLGVARKAAWGQVKEERYSFRRGAFPDLHRMQKEIRQEQGVWSVKEGGRLVFFLLASLAILAICVLFVPSASVNLEPESNKQILAFQVSASLEQKSIDPAGSLPAYEAFFVAQGTRSMAASGEQQVGDARAEGVMLLRNLGTLPLSIPKGTVICSHGSLPACFSTTEEASLPSEFGSTVEVQVGAVQAGTTGNLEANSTLIVQGMLGASLGATNPSPLEGGTDRAARIATDEDRASLRRALLAGLLEECREGFAGSLASGDVLFPETLEIYQIFSETEIPPTGQPGETLTMVIQAQCRLEYAREVDLATLVSMSMDASLPAGSLPAEQEFLILPGEPYTDATGTSRWDLRAERSLAAEVGEMAALQLILGKSQVGASTSLMETLPISAEPVILMRPSWWPWMPLLPFRIDINIGVE